MTQAFNYSRTGALLMLILFGSLSSLQAQKQISGSKNTTTAKKSSRYWRSRRLSVPTDFTFNTLFQYGVADAFIGGVFDGNYTWRELKEQGDFGLGAPDQLDGELTICDGKGYQTLSTGKTIQVTDSFKTSLAFVTFFRADTTFVISGTQDNTAAFKQIDNYVKKKNGMYAIRISGSFNQLKTRAFPPPKQPYAPLATLLNTQQFFDIKNTKGVLIGYKLPTYINGISIEGYHFHFLSDDRTQGGHMLNFSGNDLKVEVAELRDFHMTVPDDGSFMNYEFKKKQNIDLEKVEKGH
ncbi:acetolactate decarboxylase [Chitinophaga ginsengisoli]|uniref:Alpha-acetolactate decarboxylase n=1 Tax=Chitinophaga ginsengisoli TaxID=363837 RepID=A0A2P8G4S9_9BACT|nr:acetolactate decarboxylase [Chitinophaga ginsengisoli]PSL28967.1 acetolactate decarboxylase [Chitinophaga ginsengisoli]